MPDISITLYNHTLSLDVLPNRTGLFTMYSILYFMLGGVLVNKNVKPLTSMISIVCGYLLVLLDVVVSSNYDHEIQDAVNACFPTVGALLIAVGIFTLLRNIRRTYIDSFKDVIEKVSFIVLPIYLFHQIINRFISHFIHQETIAVGWALMISLSVCFLSGLISALLKRIPYIRELIII